MRWRTIRGGCTSLDALVVPRARRRTPGPCPNRYDVTPRHPGGDDRRGGVGSRRS